MTPGVEWCFIRSAFHFTPPPLHLRWDYHNTGNRGQRRTATRNKTSAHPPNIFLLFNCQRSALRGGGERESSSNSLDFTSNRNIFFVLSKIVLGCKAVREKRVVQQTFGTKWVWLCICIMYHDRRACGVLPLSLSTRCREGQSESRKNYVSYSQYKKRIKKRKRC